MSAGDAEQPPAKDRSGVVYLSSVPTGMKAAKLRYTMSQFGEVNRIYLRKEPVWKYKKRLEQGGRKGRRFTDGWVEFVRKADAKRLEAELNGRNTGMKGRWEFAIWNVKYLHGFKWTHLQEALEREQREHLEKFREEDRKAREAAREFIKSAKTSLATRDMSKAPVLDDSDSDEEEDSGA